MVAVIRVHKTKDYTVMSNAHFREKNMSLKAKGLLSLMMSLPDDWDYSIMGLTTLSKDGKDSVMSALSELEKFGYLKRSRLNDEYGRFAGYDYDIYEQPQTISVDSSTEKPYAENPNTDKPNAENPRQLNTKQSITKQSNTNVIEIKKERKKQGSFDQLIDEYLETVSPQKTEVIKGLLQDWLKVRKSKRAAMTDRAIQLNLGKLNEFAIESNMTVENYLEAVIMRGWQAFYPIKEYGKPQQATHNGGGIVDEMQRFYDKYKAEE